MSPSYRLETQCIECSGCADNLQKRYCVFFAGAAIWDKEEEGNFGKKQDRAEIGYQQQTGVAELSVDIQAAGQNSAVGERSRSLKENDQI